MMNKKYGYIYKTTNLINGKIYIGQHKASAKSNTYFGSGQILWRAIRKYGIENFKNEVLEWCYSEEELNAREIYWIEKLNARKRSVGYNHALGGNIRSVWAKGEMPQEIRDRISNKLKGHTLSEESKEKMRATRRANPRHVYHSDDSKKKLSDNAKDRISIHKGNIEKRVYQHEIQSYLDDGWELGGRQRNQRSRFQYICINNGMINKYLTKEDAEPLIATGEWQYGGKKHRFVPRGKRKFKYKTRSDKGIPRKKKKTPDL